MEEVSRDRNISYHNYTVAGEGSQTGSQYEVE